MKKIFCFTCILIMFLCNISYAEEEIIESTGSYTIGDGPEENISTAKERAKMDAMRNAVEKAGVYIESYSKTENMTLTKDEVHIIAGQILKIITSDITASIENNGSIITYKCKIKSKIDTTDVKAKAKPLLQDKMLIIRNTQLENEIHRLEKENDKLKNQYINSVGNKSDIQKKFNDNEIRLSATQWCTNGQKLSRTGNDVDAIEAFTKAIQLNPHLAVAYDERASCYLRLNEFSKALKDYDFAIRVSNNNHDYYNYRKAQIYDLKKDTSNALKYINEAVSISPNNFDFLLLQGMLYQKNNNYIQAENSFVKCTHLPSNERDDYILYINILLLEEQFQKYDNMIKAVDKLIEITPKNYASYPMLFKSKSDALLGLKRYSEAINTISQGISISPNNYRLYEARAHIYFMSKDPNNAIQDITKAIQKINVKNQYDKNNLATLFEFRAYYKLTVYDRDGAINDINKALKTSSKVVNLPRFNEALKDLDNVLANR